MQVFLNQFLLFQSPFLSSLSYVFLHIWKWNAAATTISSQTSLAEAVCVFCDICWAVLKMCILNLPAT